MRISKSDSWNHRDDLRTFASVKNNYWACPVASLARYWVFMGKPAQGIVFPSVASNYVRADSKTSFYPVKVQAAQLKLTTVPQRHTPRVTLLTMLSAMGFSDKDLANQ